MQTMAPKPIILADHKKVRSKLVTPWHQMFGPTNDVSWINEMIPELLWINLIETDHGNHRAVEIITTVARIARTLACAIPILTFANASDFARIAPGDRALFLAELEPKGVLTEIREALSALVSWFPTCPLREVFFEGIPAPTPSGLNAIKSAVVRLYDRQSRSSTMTQATAVWLAFDSGGLVVDKGLALAQFPKIEEYPDTELSQKIAASIRSTVNVLVGSHRDLHPISGWHNQFWNTGLAIEKCEFNYD